MHSSHLLSISIPILSSLSLISLSFRLSMCDTLLLHTHLLHHASSYSFDPQTGQELAHWSESVESFGVDRPEPPALVNLYRYFYGAINNSDDQKAIYAALESSSQAIAKLRSDLSESERRNGNLQQLVSQLEDRLKVGGGRGGTPSSMSSSPSTPSIVSSSSLSSVSAKESEETLKARELQHLAEEKALEAQRSAQAAAELASAKEQAKKRIPKRVRDYAFLFTRDESEMDDGARRIASEVVKLRDMAADNRSTSVILGDTLPEIVPGVILKKREELIPVIVAAVCWHPEERKRQEMMYMLFNLIRVPNAQQRRVIMDGCMNLALLTGEERTGTELLPLAVEAIASPHEERRILCADACGWLSPNVQHEMRISLLLSILHQLSQDRSPNVRSAAVVNLARVLVLEDKDKTGIDHGSSSSASSGPVGTTAAPGNTDTQSVESSSATTTGTAQDGEAKPATDSKPSSAAVQKIPMVLTIDPKKYAQLCDMILALLQDPDALVLQMTRTTLMPVFGDFVERMQLFESKYLPSLIARMKGLIGPKGVPDQKSAHELDVNSEALVYLAPVLYENALLQCDFYEEVTKGFRGPKFTSGSKYVKTVSAFTEEEKRVLAGKFADMIEATSPAEQLVSPAPKPKDEWGVLDWIVQDFLPNVLQMAIDLESDNLVVLNALCNMLSTFTQEFGETFTRKAVVPRFLSSLKSLQSAPKARSRLYILYMVAVVTGLDERDVAAHIKQCILDMALNQNGWSADSLGTFRTSLELLLEQFEDHKETILSTMAELMVHEDANVRRMLIQIYNTLVTLVSTSDVTGRILPSFITMAGDSDLTVRCDVISALGEMTIMIQDNNTTSRITAALESFITDSPKFKTVLQLIKTYAKILPSITPGFRDSFVLKQLVRLGKYTVEDEDTKRQKEMAEALFDAYRALNGMSIGRDALRNHVIPGLKNLQKIGEVLPQEKRNIVNNMIGVMEQITASSTSSSSSSTASTTATTSASGSASSTPRRSLGDKDVPATTATGGASSTSAANPSSTTSTLSGFFSGWT